MNNKSSLIKNKNILICVTGSIAAYKTCELIRQLRKEGAILQVMMTESAQKFIGKATFSALTNNEVLTDIFPNTPKAGLEHIELAMKIDIIIVCPSTANNLCKIANGVADDLISTTLSVCEQSTIFVPAMNFRMWRNQGTIDAVKKIRESGQIVMEPDFGQLASLHKGKGRLPEIISIMNEIRKLFHIKLPLEGKKVLITAGPTREPIDPVRYISNRSSGKMGYSLAKSAKDKGAEVILISGPVSLNKIEGIKTIIIETADQMYKEVQSILHKDEHIELLFMCAAVSDFKLKKIEKEKLKRGNKKSSLQLIPTPDILKSITNKNNTKIIAFALETNYNEIEAKRKLVDKNVDFIAMNINNQGITGFDSDTNELFIFTKNGNSKKIRLSSKVKIASQLIDYVISCD